ncbi:response regulator [Sphingosinicella sp. BN140058]|uniref:response regulator n=1 Tax=Sphingosinicella sp. BN140058 TaxID=1892855 RepID=UPI0013EC239F|nr:response regulator [Sphingosinicella sp. BN140058]
MLLADHLREAQFEVAEAADADQAVKLLDELPGVEAVISDVRMPGSMDGVGLAHEIAARWPDVTVILTSGFLGDDHERLPPCTHFVGKPYQLEQFTSLLRSSLP